MPRVQGPAGCLTVLGRVLLVPMWWLMLNLGYDPAPSQGALKCPLFQTSTFVFSTAAEAKRAFEVAHGVRAPGVDEAVRFTYSRSNNPNLEIFERRFAAWEGAQAALVFSSGMAAISSAILAYARPGSVVIHSNPVYGGTDHLLHHILPLFDVGAVGLAAPGRPDQLAAAIEVAKPLGPVAAVYLETPANPTGLLYDVSAIAAALRQAYFGAGYRPLLMTDNTLLGPLWQQPLRLGADLSLYSLSKYVGGHSDLVAGGCVGDASTIGRIREFRKFLGGVADPHTAWLLMRSLETLQLRMERAGDSAREIARFLHLHPKVEQVHYLGLLEPGSEQRRIFDAQCSGAGATFSFLVKGGEAEAYRFLDALRIVRLAVSLGGGETLASHPATTTHIAVGPDVKTQYGITPNLIRLSIGIEHLDDLKADFAQALDKV